MGKVTPFLWLDGTAEQAAQLYSEVLGASVSDIQRLPDGAVFLVKVSVQGLELELFNGGPMFAQTEAFSLVVVCEDQAEIDRIWEALTANGGQESQCGWLKDPFGVSWQIIPSDIQELIGNPGGHAAMMTMTKLDIAALQAAAT